MLPGSKRVDGRRLTFSADDMLAAYLAFQAAVALVADKTSACSSTPSVTAATRSTNSSGC